MTIESAESIDLQEQRAELQAVLQSRDFVRAPKLAQLLAYLCERLFAGEANQIKEYSIGLEVFRRGATFDQDSDSIVRVEANRLRRRLADYYAGEGASHRLQITIPVGQYVPKFDPVVPHPSPNGTANSLTVDEGQAEVVTPSFSGWRRWLDPKGRRPWWLVAGFVIVVLGLGIGYPWYLIHLQRTPVPVALPERPAAEISDMQFGPPGGDEIRILAGATRSFVDHAGKLWSADVAFTGGTAVKNSIQHIDRTQDPDFYRTSRQGQFRYDIPLKKGIYELRLHFAETVYGPETTGTGGEGSRIMTVRANGHPLLTNFDVVADSGESRTADVKVFPDIAPAADGQLHLEFAGDDGKLATLSAIEILPGVRGHMRPVRILARQTPYYSNDSHWWSPDSYFEGGESGVLSIRSERNRRPGTLRNGALGELLLCDSRAARQVCADAAFRRASQPFGPSQFSGFKTRHRACFQCVLQWEIAPAELRPAEGSARRGRAQPQVYGSGAECAGQVAAKLCAGGRLCFSDRD